jgi:ABC-type multidrug transport system ATPase subunit
MGKTTRTGGNIKINGSAADMQMLKKIIGYVSQDDIMLRELTVREIILYSARVRLPRDWNNKEVEQHVDNVIQLLK